MMHLHAVVTCDFTLTRVLYGAQVTEQMSTGCIQVLGKTQLVAC